jgi:hypothetical protein
LLADLQENLSMYNAAPPPDTTVPTTLQLVRATLISIASAAVILVAIVLPAEYAIDPTRIGRILGLTEMGEIKRDLEKEANEHSQAAPTPRDRRGALETLGALLIRPAHARTEIAQASEQAPDKSGWKDETSFALEPGQGLEIKLTMTAGSTATYSCAATGGRINFDLHAHADGKTARYAKGRGKTGAAGSFTAKFDGNHGWFFRNRDRKTVEVVMKLKGDYTAIVRN